MGDLEGAVALAPLVQGDIVDRSSVSPTGSSAPERALSFAVGRERALDGRLQPGDSVDLLATYGTGETARTLVVARRVRLIDLDDAQRGLDSTGKIVVTVALVDPDDVLRVAHASQVATVTLVRSSGGSGDSGGDSYSFPSAGPGGDSRSPTSAPTTTPG